LRLQRITAILDVHYIEPLPVQSPFRGLSNVILTPHNAGYGRREFYVPHVLNEFHRFFTNRPLQHEVHPAAVARMTDESLVTFDPGPQNSGAMATQPAS
jgi:phosphoglycerate dehydrogenase-like enzyme